MSATWMRAQEFGQPLTLMVMRLVEVGQPLAPARSTSSARAGLGLDDRELAELDAGAGHRAAPPGRRARPRRPSAAQRRRPATRPGPRATSSTSSFWYGGEPHPVAAVRLGEVGEPGEHACRRPGPTTGRDADVVAAVPLLVHADVVDAAARGSVGRRAVDQRAAEVLLLEHLAELRSTPQSATRNFSRARVRSRR